MKPKVGIVTIHYVDNIGGVLLAYALQESVQRLGYDCRIVDYDPTPVPSTGSYLLKTLTRRATQVPRYLKDLPYYVGKLVNGGSLMPPRHLHGSSGVRKVRFDAFRQRHIRMSELRYTTSDALQSSPPGYHAYICGSDQVWNPYICKTPDQARNEPPYFLRFAEEGARVSYAPSISIPVIPEHLRAEMTEFMKGVPHLSCREQQGADLIREMTGREAQVVLDPTLLLGQEQWRQLAVEPEVEQPYILCYFLGEGQQYRNFAREFSRRTGLPLVVISREERDLAGPQTTNCNDAGPAEFLGLIKNASCVLTDSFHGTIFSINFGTPFFSFERPGSDGKQSMSSRIHSVLQLLGLGARLIPCDADANKVPLDMAWGDAHELLERERTKSLRYLEAALQQASGR